MLENRIPIPLPPYAPINTNDPENAENDVEANATDHGLKRIFKNTAWLLAGKGFGGVLSLFYIAILTRTLGPVGWGQFALITGAATAIAIFASFQTWQVVVRFGIIHLGQSADSGRFNRLIGICVLFDLLGGLAGCAIILAASKYIGSYFAWDSAMTWAATLYSMTIILALKSTPTGILRALNRFDLGTYADAMIPLIRLIGVVSAWIWAPSLYYFLLAWAAAEVVNCVVYWGLAYHQIARKFRWSQAFQFQQALQENLGIRNFLVVTNIGSTLNNIAQNSAVLLVGFFAGPAAAGLFRLASQISTAMTKISSLLSRAIFAEVNQVRTSHGDDALRGLFRQTTQFLFLAGIAVMGAVFLLGKPVLLLMSGPQFLAAYPLLIILAAAACIDLAGAIYEPVLLSGGAAQTTLWLNAINVAGFIGIIALLMPTYGVQGAAWAMLASALLRLLMFGFAARRHLSAHEE